MTLQGTVPQSEQHTTTTYVKFQHLVQCCKRGGGWRKKICACQQMSRTDNPETTTEEYYLQIEANIRNSLKKLIIPDNDRAGGRDESCRCRVACAHCSHETRTQCPCGCPSSASLARPQHHLIDFPSQANKNERLPSLEAEFIPASSKLPQRGVHS